MRTAGEIINGRYQINGYIGKGGMSIVYQATDLANGALLAIKEVQRSGKVNSQVVTERLSLEGNLLMHLDNPHLTKIHDIIEGNDTFMIVMDYIDGQSLDKFINTYGPQSEENVYNWALQICDVFSYLHNQQPPIIYRDMKPANIMLRTNGTITLIDFGTARRQKEGVVSDDTILMGTEGFAAPEQFGGLGQSDARTDIYCLGATLYNLLTGHSPSEPPRGIFPLGEMNPALAKSSFNQIIQRCTQKDPSNRYQSAEELKADLLNGRKGGKVRGIRLGGWKKQALEPQNETGLLEGLIDTPQYDQETQVYNIPQPAQDYQPTQPVQAYQPAQPVQAYQPAQPVQAYQPAKPAQAYQPAQPVQAYQPAKPDRKNQPEYTREDDKTEKYEQTENEGERSLIAIVLLLLGIILMCLGILSLVLMQFVIGLVISIVAIVSIIVSIIAMAISR